MPRSRLSRPTCLRRSRSSSTPSRFCAPERGADRAGVRAELRRAIAIRSSGATRARSATDARSGSSSSSPAAATPPPITTRSGQRKMRTFAIARPISSPARASAAVARSSPARRARPPRRTSSRPAARGDRARARVELEAAAVAALAHGAVLDDGVVAELAGALLRAEVQRGRRARARRRCRCRRRRTSRSPRAAAGAERRLGERERVAVVDSATGRAERSRERRRDRAAPPVAVQVREQDARVRRASKSPGSATPTESTAAGGARELDACRSSTASGPPSLRARRRLGALDDRAVLEQRRA